MTTLSTSKREIKQAAEDFPILQQKQDIPLTYLDSAASSQKPQVVIDSVSHYYTTMNANVHRGVYQLSQRSTAAYEAARETIRSFINARNNHEIVFTKGTTESINLVANSFGQDCITAGDEIIISTMDHHSNIVPWQLLCERTGAVLRVIHIHPDGTLDLDHYRQLLNEKTKLVSIVHVSNVLGTINPVKTIIDLAHQQQIPVLLDGAQSIPHLPIDVQSLGCDFFAFSSHKLYGPTGFGVLYAKESLLERLPPYQGGGSMIRRVTFERTDYHELPYKFEAGTPNMAGAVGMAAAIDYLSQFGMEAIESHEERLMKYATEALLNVPGLQIIGTAENKAGAISFVMDAVHPHDIGTILDHESVAVRVGHHCAMPLMDYFGLPATVRASFGIYNNETDVDRLIAALYKVRKVFHV